MSETLSGNCCLKSRLYYKASYVNRDEFNFHSVANEIFSQIFAVKVLLLLFFKEKKRET